MKKLLLLGIAIMFTLAGCNTNNNGSESENNEKKEALIAYYDNIIKGEFEKAYDLLSEKTKQKVNKEEFILWQTLMDEIEDFMSAEVKATKDENVFTVEETFKDYYENKVLTATSERKVVVENNKVKIDREDIHTNKAIGESYSTIGLMYADGKGKPEDLMLAEENLKKALQYDPENAYSYLNLGYIFYKKELFQESILEYNKALDNMPESDLLGTSIALSNIGGSYYEMGDVEKAREFHTRALEVDPNNEYAKNGLAVLEDN